MSDTPTPRDNELCACCEPPNFKSVHQALPVAASPPPAVSPMSATEEARHNATGAEPPAVSPETVRNTQNTASMDAMGYYKPDPPPPAVSGTLTRYRTESNDVNFITATGERWIFREGGWWIPAAQVDAALARLTADHENEQGAWQEEREVCLSRTETAEAEVSRLTAELDALQAKYKPTA